MKSFWRAAIIRTCLILFVALSQGCGGGSQPLSQSLPAPLTITPASLPTGTAYSQYNQTIKASGGIAPFSWTISSGALPNNLSLTSSSTNFTTITGTPDTPTQAAAFTLEVMDADGQSATQAYTIAIAAGPDTLTLSTADLTFSPQLVGSTSAAQTVTITNTGTAPVNIAAVTVAGNNPADFILNTNTCGANLAGGANCTVKVTFTPGKTGPLAAALSISDDTAGSPQLIPLSGTGLTSGPNVTLSATYLAFVRQTINVTSLPESLTLNNYGTVALDISTVTASATFAQTNDCIPAVASNGSCTISVTFTPTASGSTSGILSITDNINGSPQTVALTGNGTTNQASLTGYCWYSEGPVCQTASDPTECPPGEPVRTAVMAVGGCFPPQSQLIDPTKGCHKTARGQYAGVCMATWGDASGSAERQRSHPDDNRVGRWDNESSEHHLSGEKSRLHSLTHDRPPQ